METPTNPTMLEAWEWHLPPTSTHYRTLTSKLPLFSALGITTLLLPPGCKAGGRHSNGYDVYDLYDIGEFDQKGGRATKWGTKEELLDLIAAAKHHGIGVLWDAVLNHRANADYTERCSAVEVDPDDRTKEIAEPREIEAWLGFDYAARGGKYSTMRYNWRHFNGTDYDALTQSTAIFRLIGEGKTGWAEDVDSENGNADYLMFADVDLAHEEVKQALFNWGDWLGSELQLAGIRFDAVKHFSEKFMKDFVQHIDQTVGADWLLVGEYCLNDVEILTGYVERLDRRMALFDFPLNSNLVGISRSTRGDLRTVFKDTLVEKLPDHAVTFITNHDTQERDQETPTTVAPSFIPQAYAFILLRDSGHPCLFYGDLFGVQKPDAAPPAHRKTIARLACARNLFAYGEQTEYMDERDCIGFTRHGVSTRGNGAGLAVVMSNGLHRGKKLMFVGKQHAGEIWTDILQSLPGEVQIDEAGVGSFTCQAQSVAVWVHADAEGRVKIEEGVSLLNA